MGRGGGEDGGVCRSCGEDEGGEGDGGAERQVAGVVRGERVKEEGHEDGGKTQVRGEGIYALRSGWQEGRWVCPYRSAGCEEGSGGIRP